MRDLYPNCLEARVAFSNHLSLTVLERSTGLVTGSGASGACATGEWLGKPHDQFMGD